MNKFNSTFFILFFLIFFFNSCIQREIPVCQNITWRGYSTNANCAYDNNGNHYNEFGILGPLEGLNFNDPNEFRILILGSKFITGENQNKEDRFVARLQDELRQVSKKKIIVINGGINNVSSIYLQRMLPRLVNAYKPHMTLYFMSEETLSGEYFSPDKVIDVCPLSNILELQYGFSSPLKLLFGPSARFINYLQAQSPKNKTIWLSAGLDTKNILKALPGCEFLKGVVKEKKYTLVQVQEFLVAEDIPILSSGSFSWAHWKAFNGSSRIRDGLKVYNSLMARTLVPWILPDIN